MNKNRSAFVLCSAQGHSLIVNRNDYTSEARGVGLDLLELGCHEPGTTMFVCGLIEDRRKQFGDGVVVVDGGANIGAMTVTWARFMGGQTEKPWGEVICFEPQRYVFCALAGNIVINNCFNATPYNAALSGYAGTIRVPYLDPNTPHNFGGCELNKGGLVADCYGLDDFHLPRLDVLKLDVEGMEPDVLRGARETIERCSPIIIAEAFKCGPDAIAECLPDYSIVGKENVICVHKDEDNPRLQSIVRNFADRAA